MDGHKVLTSKDMARLASRQCAGCGACCRGMGDTILLDPYDVCQLTNGLQRSFDELLGDGVDLHVEKGIILPHMKMDEARDACHFLDAGGRCKVHAFRPGICRLFPLGRHYNNTDESTGASADADKLPNVTYFLLEDACTDPSRTKVRVDKWLGIPDLPSYEAFKFRWHRMLRTLAARIAAEDDQETVQKVNVFFLQTFYMKPYERKTFYEEMERRMERFQVVL